MRLKEFLLETKEGGYLIKNNLTYLPLETWMRQETGEDPTDYPEDSELTENDEEEEKADDGEDGHKAVSTRVRFAKVGF